jgi:hypothetical protein
LQTIRSLGQSKISNKDYLSYYIKISVIYFRGIKIEKPGFPLAGRLLMKLVMAKSILGVEKGGKLSNAYALVQIKGDHPKSDKTQIVDSLNPEWNVEYEYRIERITEKQVYFLKISHNFNF